MNLRIYIYIIAVFSVNSLFAQTSDSLSVENGVDYQKRYVNKLRQYILEAERKTNFDKVEQELFLIEMTNLVINEVKKRNPNHVYAATSYFNSLERFLYRINKIILRLRENGATDLVRFAKELRQRVKDGLKAKKVEFKLEQFFERSIQLLLIAEKAFSVAGESGSESLMESFGNVLNRNLYEVSDSLKAENPDIITLLSLITEEERNRFLHYVVSKNYLDKYIDRMVSSGKKESNLLFAKEVYTRALLAFEKQRYELSKRLFDSLIKHFDFLEQASKYRISYFSALSSFYSNKYGYAEKKLETMLKTTLADRVLAYAISDVYRINNRYEKLERIVKRYESLPSSLMLPQVSLADEFYFKAARKFFLNNQYVLAIEIFSKVSSNYDLYYDAKLLTAMAKYALKSPEASALFETLINDKNVTERVVISALIKRAQISYDNKEYEIALDYLSQVDENNNDHIEEFFTTKAWTLFSYIRSNTELNKDYSQVKVVIERFLDRYKVSDFIGEMRTLLGYIKKLEDNYTGAETEYQYVFDLKRYKRLSDELLLEEDSLKLTKVKIDESMKTAVNRGEKSLFKRFDDLAFTVDTILTQIKYADQTVVSPTSYNDLSKIYNIISEMERLRIFAEENKDEKLLEVIDLKISRMYAVVLRNELPERNKLFSFNFFFEHSLSRKISKNQYINNKLTMSISSIEKEQNEINARIKTLDQAKLSYKKRRDYEKVASMDVAVVRLKQALQRLDFILTVAKQRPAIKNSARIDHWANFTAYELTNVQFVQKTTIENQNSEMSEVIKNITQSVKDRKTVISQQVQSIEKTIALMNRRILKERRIAEREKVREMFKTEFFDESSTEINEDSIRKVFELNALKKRVGRIDTILSSDSLGVDSLKSITPLDKSSNERDSQNKEENNTLDSSLIKDEEN